MSPPLDLRTKTGSGSLAADAESLMFERAFDEWRQTPSGFWCSVWDMARCLAWMGLGAAAALPGARRFDPLLFGLAFGLALACACTRGKSVGVYALKHQASLSKTGGGDAPSAQLGA